MTPHFIRRIYSQGIGLLIAFALFACTDQNLIEKQPVSDQALLPQGNTTIPVPLLTDEWSPLPNPGELSPYGKDVLSFLIRTKAYILLSSRSEVWEYDLTTNALVLKGSMPALSAFNVGAFTIGPKGYVMGGDKFWEYDPVTNVWTSKAPFPGIDRFEPVCFAIGGKGYVSSGQKVIAPTPLDYVCNDLWEYNPNTNAWTQKANIPVSRGGAMGVATTTKGYIGCGHRKIFNLWTGTIKQVYLNDWWEYNPTTNAWTAKANFPGNGRILMESFTVNNLPYLGGGYNSGDPNKISTPDVWRFDPTTNEWLVRKNFPVEFDGTWATTFGNTTNGYLVVGNFTSMWKYWK